MARRTTLVFVISRYPSGVTPDPYVRDWPGGNGPSYSFNVTEAFEIGRGYGQAQATIKAIRFIHGQAQAQIKQTYFAHGQAQGEVGTGFLTRYGQAQAYILPLTGIGQAQAHIKTTTNSYGQAQGTILVIVRRHAQAQAKVVSTRFILGQAQGTISTTTPSAQAQALIRITDIEGLAQALAHIKVTRRPFANALARVKQTYYPWAQAQAIITHSQAYGQASVYVPTGTLVLDTYSRIVETNTEDTEDPNGPGPTVNNYTDLGYPDIGPKYRAPTPSWLQGVTPEYYEDATINGSYLVVSGSHDYAYLNAIIPINVKNATFQIDFMTPVVNDFMTYADIAIRDNLFDVGADVLNNVTDTQLTIQFNSVTIPTLSGNTWYTLKVDANDATIRAKVWDRNTAEPGWMVTETHTWLEPGALEVYTDIGENLSGPSFVYLDNLNVYGTDIPIIAKYKSAQAEAYISNGARKYGQARAKIVRALDGSTLIHQDTFTREGNFEVIGTPDIGSYNGATTIPGGYVTGTTLLLTDESQIRTGATAENVEAYVDFRFNSLSQFMFIELEARTGLSNADISIAYDGPGESYFLITGTLHSIPDPEEDVWYTLKIRTDYTMVRGKYWEREDVEPDWMYSGTAASATGSIDVDFIHGTDGTADIDNFNVYRLDPPSPYSGQAQAYISTTLYRIPGQARAYIRLNKGSGQAQAYIKKRINRHGLARAVIARTGRQGTGQAQGSILPVSIRNSSGNAQGYITKPQRSAQAQAKILAFGQRPYGQAQARILAKTQTYAHGQAMGMLKMPAIGQAAALIGSQKYLVRFNNYDLPGYAQEESLESIMDIVKHEVTYEDGSLSEYIGLRNKILSLRMKAVGSTYGQVKRDVQRAMTMARSSRGYAKLYVQNYDKYYEALTRKISTEKTVRESMRQLDYTVEWEVKPWLVSDKIYIIDGTGTITTDDVSRTLSNGGWSPVIISVDGTDVTVSGYNYAGHQTGYLVVSGAVTNLLIDSNAYTATINGQNVNNIMTTPNYQMYVGPGKTTFVITGATRAEISWQDRWYL